MSDPRPPGPHSDPRPPGPRDWKCDYSLDQTEVHVRPRNDHIWHQADEDCPCGPTYTYVDLDTPIRWIAIHHALDGRRGNETKLAPTPAPTAAAYDDGDGPCGVNA